MSPILIITGPTASGKSAIALAVAQKLGGVIINADSQQLYASLRILTARPSVEEEALIPHKLYGTIPAEQHCSAGIWLNLAKIEIDWARAQGQTPIIVGGTGLYIKTLLEGIADIPDITEEVRAQGEADYEQMGKDAFADRLKWVDPAFFERLEVYDRQRLIRAYNVWLGTGKPLSYWQDLPTHSPYPTDITHLYNVEIPRETLYERCNLRVEKMVEEGALDEVRSLYDTFPNAADLPVAKSVGVREFAAHLQGDSTLEEAIEATQQGTRRYAKRQLTWLRNQLPQAQPIAFDDDPIKIADKLAQSLALS